MKKNNWLKKIGTLLFALAIAMSFTVTAFAGAADGTGAGSLPDPNATGSVTVHKYSTASASSTPGTGLELSAEEAAKLGTPLENVGFTLYQIIEDYDEDTNPGGFKVDSTFRTAVVEDPVALENFLANNTANYQIVGEERFTDSSGVISWGTAPDAGLPVGYYILIETTPPVDMEVDPAIPSVITMPFGYTESGRGWTYDIHVYPKNVKTAPITKEVKDDEGVYTVGDKITWKIDAKITDPPLYIAPSDDGAGNVVSEAWGYYAIADELDTRLTYVAAADPEDPTAPFGSVLTAHGGNPAPLALTAGDDYELIAPTEANNNTISWKMTNAGLKKLQENGASSVSVEFVTVINNTAVSGTPVSDPTISNGADMNFSNADDWTGNEADLKTESIPEEEKPTVKLGGVQILKVDNEDHDLKLDGAEFKVALSKADAQNGVFVKYGLDSAAEDIVIVTGSPYEAGWAQFIGLPLNTNADGDILETTYYLVEVRAPENYILRQSIIEITLPAGSKLNEEPELVVNQHINGPEIDEDRPSFLLPKTGGIGVAIFTVVGIALIAGAVLLLVKSKKKNKA